MLWKAVFNLFCGECIAVLILMTFNFLPASFRRPIRSAMSKLRVPQGKQLLVATIVVLLALFVESVRKGMKEKQHESDDFKDKLLHDNRRLRSERNSYIAFGCLFVFMIMAFIWSLLKEIIDLEDQKEKQEKIHGAYMKQVKNKDAQSGLVEVAKGLRAVEKGEESMSPEELATENKRLKQLVGALKEEKLALEAQLNVIESKDSDSKDKGGARKRAGAGAAKDD